MTHLGHRASTASVRLGVARTVKRRPFAMWGRMVAAPSPVSAAGSWYSPIVISVIGLIARKPCVRHQRNSAACRAGMRRRLVSSLSAPPQAVASACLPQLRQPRDCPPTRLEPHIGPHATTRSATTGFPSQLPHAIRSFGCSRGPFCAGPRNPLRLLRRRSNSQPPGGLVCGTPITR